MNTDSEDYYTIAWNNVTMKFGKRFEWDTKGIY